MLLLITMLALCAVIQDIHTENTKIFDTDNGQIKLQYTFFKKHLHFQVIADYVNATDEYTMINHSVCGQKCQQKQNCTMYQHGNDATSGIKVCKLYDIESIGKYDTVFGYSETMDLYEKKNKCTVNPGICEHGSTCVPSNTEPLGFYCKYCLEPFTGTFCNETVAAVPSVVLHKDVLSGKNQSCISIQRYFGIETAGSFIIHPWKDWRSITVFCYPGGAMRLVHINDQSKDEWNDFGDLVDGIDLSQENTRIAAPIATKLYKLTKFSTLHYTCQLASDNVKKTFAAKKGNEFQQPHFLYLIGMINSRREVFNTFEEYGVHDGVLVENKLSNPDGNPDYRLGDKVLRFTNGDVLGFSHCRFGCFSAAGCYNANDKYFVYALP